MPARSCDQKQQQRGEQEHASPDRQVCVYVPLAACIITPASGAPRGTLSVCLLMTNTLHLVCDCPSGLDYPKTVCVRVGGRSVKQQPAHCQTGCTTECKLNEHPLSHCFFHDPLIPFRVTAEQTTYPSMQFACRSEGGFHNSR